MLRFPRFSGAIAAKPCPPRWPNADGATRFPHPQGTTGAALDFPHEEGSTMTERRKKSSRKTARKRATKTATKKGAPKRWSGRVTRESDALDLKGGVFKQTSAMKIAASLKRSAERSSRRKAGAYRSALSMLVFYINRAGKNLPKTQRERLERAKGELKQQFGRE
jgi:hypothetical protein